MVMVPMPMLSEKNAWPRASKMPVNVSLEKSGLSRKASPSRAPGSVRARMQSKTMSSKSMGIRILLYFSMPS